MALFAPPACSARASLGLLVPRVIVGAAFILHGWPKVHDATGWMGPNPPFPPALVALGAYAELVGGACFVLGFLTPIAALALTIMMFIASTMVHMAAGDPFVPSQPGGPSYELAAAYFGVSWLLLMA